jgi:3-hydroxyisobutyrate dehydrogenase
MSQIAVLGAGEMGSRMAQNLLNKSRTRDKVMPLIEQGAVYVATPRNAAQQAEVVISMVTDDQASRTIWLTPETGAIAGLNETQIAIESSTLTVEWTKTLAAKIDRGGAAFLDAPVVGSRPQADAGKLIYRAAVPKH